MNAFEKLNKLNLPEDAMVNLSFSDGTSVFVHNETAVETAIAETSVIASFSDLVATPGLNVFDLYGSNIIEDMRENGYLDDYERDYTFAEYLTETIAENFYDIEFIENTVERHDYKRGFCTLETTVQVPFQNFVDTRPFINGWTVSVSTDDGTLSFEA